MQLRRALMLILLSSLLCTASAAAQPAYDAQSPLLRLIAHGDASLRAGDSISALGFYRDAVSRAPRDPRGYVALGRGYLQVGEAAHAREAFETGLRHTNGSEALALGLSEAFERLGQLARALEVVRPWLREAEEPALVYERLAHLAELRSAFTEALAARRSKLAALRKAGDDAGSAAEQTRVRALQLLLGASDRTGPARCHAVGRSTLLAVLFGCR